MKPIKTIRSSFAANFVVSTIILLLVFGLIVSAIGYISFTESFKSEYADTTYHMADTATTLINGDEIDSYLQNGGDSDSYRRSAEYLDSYCQKMDVTLIYVIKVDTTDYSRFTSVFNAVRDGSDYTPWEIGYQQDTTNEEYAKTYRDLYEGSIEYGTVYRTANLRGKMPHITTLAPVKDSAGEVVSILCIQRPMEALTSGRRPYLVTIAFSTIILMILASVVSTAYIRRHFVSPIRRIIDEAQRFAKEHVQGEKLGKDISRIEDISALASSIDVMEEDMLTYISDLTVVTAEKERIGTELMLASSIQSGSIPHTFPAFPERDDFDIYATMQPAKAVGGDLYDFFLVDDDHLALSIGDVAGKGVPAALFMMVTNILINEHTKSGRSPAEILSLVNSRICDHNPMEMFVSVWLGVLELSTGKLVCANAGHEMPAIMRRNSEFKLYKSKHGLVLGAYRDIKYQNIEIQLESGDKLFLYTDGVPEATDRYGCMFSLDNMLVSLNMNKNKSPQEIIEGIQKSVADFIGEEPPFDDLTAVCLELKKVGEDKMLIDATPENLTKVNQMVDDFLADKNCSFKTRSQIEIAVEEIYINIARYAYPNGGGKAEIILMKNNEQLVMTFKDKGIPYNPLAKPDPDTTLSAAERQIGGLGIFLVKKIMDDVIYEYKDGYNILTIIKNLN